MPIAGSVAFSMAVSFLKDFMTGFMGVLMGGQIATGTSTQVNPVLAGAPSKWVWIIATMTGLYNGLSGLQKSLSAPVVETQLSKVQRAPSA